MNAVRIRKRLDAPIPGLPELEPMIGKDVEIIVLEEGPGAAPKQDLSALFELAGTDALDFDSIEKLREISKI